MSDAEEYHDTMSSLATSNESYKTASDDLEAQGIAGPSNNVKPAEIPEVKPARKIPELDLQGNLTDSVVKKFRHRVVEELKECYRGEGSSELVQAVHSLAQIYGLAFQHRAGTRFVQLLLLDLERRVQFMVDNDHYLVGRMRTLSVMARFASQLVEKNAENTGPLEFLVDFCEKHHSSTSYATRSLVTYLAGEVLVSSVGEAVKKPSEDELLDDDNLEFPVYISLDCFSKLFTVIQTRTKDKHANVRREAIRAMSHVQDDDIWGEYNRMVDVPPIKICVKFVTDENPEVRAIAVKNLLIKDHASVRVLVSRAVKDPEWNIQKEAYIRVCQDLHVGAFSVAERMMLMDCVCNHDEVFMREMAVKLISTWANHICREIQKEAKDIEALGRPIPMELYAKTPLLILPYLDIMANRELCQTVMIHLFYIASLRYPDISNTSSYVLHIKDLPNILHRQNYESVLGYKRVPLKEIAHRICFWRTFVTFAQRASKDSAEVEDVTHQLLPPMRPFCEFIDKFVKFISLKFEGDSKEPYKIFAISELLNLVKFIEKDVLGLVAWRSLLTTLLTTNAIPVNHDLVDQCISDLFAHHYPHADDIPSGIAEVTDATAALIAKEVSPEGTLLMNGTISLAQHGDPNYQPGLEDMVAAPVPQATGNTLTRCLMIIDSMMRTGKISDMEDPLVTGIYENFIEQGAISKKADDRRYAFRCFCIMSMHNMNFARSKFATLKKALQIEIPDNKAVVIRGVADIVLHWKYKEIVEHFGYFDHNGKTYQLAEMLSNMSEQNSYARTELPQIIRRCMMKWMMKEEHSDWVHPLATLLLFWARPDTYAKRSSERVHIEQFFTEFVEKSRFRRSVMAQALFTAFAVMKGAELGGPLANIDPEIMVDKILELTDEIKEDLKTEKKKPEKKPETASKETTPREDRPSVHLELLGMCLQYLTHNPNDEYLNAVVRLLSELNLDGLKAEMATECDWNEQLKLVLDEVDEDNQKATKLLRSFIRNFEARMRSSVSSRRRNARKAPTRVQATSSISFDQSTLAASRASTVDPVASLSMKELAASLPTIDEESVLNYDEVVVVEDTVEEIEDKVNVVSRPRRGRPKKPSPAKEVPVQPAPAKPAPASMIPVRSTRSTRRVNGQETMQAPKAPAAKSPVKKVPVAKATSSKAPAEAPIKTSKTSPTKRTAPSKASASKVPVVSTTRSTRVTRPTVRAEANKAPKNNESESEQGGRADSGKEISDLTNGIVQLHLERRPLRENNTNLPTKVSGLSKSKSLRKPASIPGESKKQKSDHDDDEDFVKTQRKVKTTVTRNNPFRGTRKHVAIFEDSLENED